MRSDCKSDRTEADRWFRPNGELASLVRAGTVTRPYNGGTVTHPHNGGTVTRPYSVESYFHCCSTTSLKPLPLHPLPFVVIVVVISSPPFPKEG